MYAPSLSRLPHMACTVCMLHMPCIVHLLFQAAQSEDIALLHLLQAALIALSARHQISPRRVAGRSTCYGTFLAWHVCRWPWGVFRNLKKKFRKILCTGRQELRLLSNPSASEEHLIAQGLKVLEPGGWRRDLIGQALLEVRAGNRTLQCQGGEVVCIG